MFPVLIRESPYLTQLFLQFLIALLKIYVRVILSNNYLVLVTLRSFEVFHYDTFQDLVVKTVFELALIAVVGLEETEERRYAAFFEVLFEKNAEEVDLVVLFSRTFFEIVFFGDFVVVLDL